MYTSNPHFTRILEKVYPYNTRIFAKSDPRQIVATLYFNLEIHPSVPTYIVELSDYLADLLELILQVVGPHLSVVYSRPDCVPP